MNKLLLIGGGGHCKSCIDVIEQDGQFEIVGIIDKVDKIGKKVLGYNIIASDRELPKLRHQFDYALVTIGQLSTAELRIGLYNTLKKLEFNVPTIFSPFSYISKYAQIGDGTIIMHHAVVNAGAKIGKNCIINTKALIEHDATVGNHCHVSTNAIINGGVYVSDSCFIGSAAITKQCVQIPENSFIKAGSVIK
jgi:sugar O-acyltransferase (sialic acid O-acetyltransferase NeuD family)